MPLPKWMPWAWLPMPEQRDASDLTQRLNRRLRELEGVIQQLRDTVADLDTRVTTLEGP